MTAHELIELLRAVPPHYLNQRVVIQNRNDGVWRPVRDLSVCLVMTPGKDSIKQVVLDT